MSIDYLENREYEKTSRYQILRVLLNDNQRYLETYNQVKIPESDNDTYHIVSFNEEGRLDIIANNYYNDPSFWWILAVANQMIDPFDFKKGVMIRIPPITSVASPNAEVLYRRS